MAGRPLAKSDRLDTPAVAVVNQAMAEALWPTEDPIGKTFRFGSSISGSIDSIEREYFDRDFTVVGVAGVERREQLAEEAMAEFYLPTHRCPGGPCPW